MPYVEGARAGAIRTWYEEQGRGEPVVLVGGLSSTIETWVAPHSMPNSLISVTRKATETATSWVAWTGAMSSRICIATASAGAVARRFAASSEMSGLSATPRFSSSSA